MTSKAVVAPVRYPPTRTGEIRGFTLGIDVGGTCLRAQLTAGSSPVGVPIDRLRGSDVRRNAMTLVDDMLAQTDELGGVVRRVGIALPGPVDIRSGLLWDAPGDGLRAVDWAEMLPEGCRPLFLNDAVSALAAEVARGAARGSTDVAGFFLGTGVGGALVVGGQVLQGRSGAAAELGHVVVAPGGRRCDCGGRGCLQQYSSGTAVARRFVELAGARPVRGTREAARLARAGNVAALRAFQEAGQHLGVAIASVVSTTDPELVVIGGGLAPAHDLFLPAAIEALREHTSPRLHPLPEVVLGSLQRLAGAHGAAIAADAEARQ